MKSEGENLMGEEKKEDTEVGLQNNYTELMFNEFLDVTK